MVGEQERTKNFGGGGNRKEPKVLVVGEQERTKNFGGGGTEKSPETLGSFPNKGFWKKQFVERLLF